MEFGTRVAIQQLLIEKGLTRLSHFFRFPHDLWGIVLVALESSIGLLPANEDAKQALFGIPSGEQIMGRIYYSAEQNFRESVEWLNSTRSLNQQLETEVHCQTFRQMIEGLTADRVAEGLYIFKTFIPISELTQNDTSH